MSIKKTLYCIVALIFLAMSTMMATSHYFLGKIEAVLEACQLVSIIEVDMLILRKEEKDFLARKDLKYKEKFDSTFINTIPPNYVI